MPITSKCKADLLKQINEISFVLDEMRLYLDTHPDCREALEYYNKYAARRAEVMEDYKRMYGPLSFYDFSDCSAWQWVQGAMPWEGV